MVREEIYEKVTSVTCEMLGASKDSVTGDKRFIEDLGADSLDQVEIVMALEDAFGIEIDDSLVESVKTIDDVVNAIVDKTAESVK
jgi:acyl carrier protein